MKISHYDVLQVSPRAMPEVIKAAYQNLKPGLTEQAREGSDEARNQLLFLDEAYAVLSSPEKRSAYDESLAQTSPAAHATQNISYTYESESAFRGWWGDAKTSRFLIAVAFFAAIFAAYKFTGQRADQQMLGKQVDTQAEKEVGMVRNDSYRAENERMLVQGAVNNQGVLIEKSYDIAAQEAARRKAELDYRANAGSQMLEMQRQQLEAQQQQQRWAQEQYEKDRQAREARAVADAPKKQLCNMYALNGNVRDARAAGCY